MARMPTPLFIPTFSYRCTFGFHDWVTGEGHWRRWCARCGSGRERAPTRPRKVINMNLPTLMALQRIHAHAGEGRISLSPVRRRG